MRPRFDHFAPIAFAGMALAAPAHADDGGAINLNSFTPALDSRGYVTVDASEVLGHQDVAFGLVTNWGYNLLQFENEEDTYQVRHHISPTFLGAYGLELGPVGVQLGATLPTHVVSGERDPDFVGEPGANIREDFGFGNQGIGDLALHGKLRLLSARNHPVGLGVVGSVSLPTATQENAWLGADSAVPEVYGIVDREFTRRLQGSANVGVRVRDEGEVFTDDPAGDDPPPPATGESMALGTTVPFGAGVSYAVVPEEFDLMAEVFGAVPVGEAENYAPLEALGGAKFYLAENSFLSFGAGAGLLPGEGANPDFRSFLGIVFEPRVGSGRVTSIPNQAVECPDDPADYDHFLDQDCPGDMPGYGLVDGDDTCVGEDCPGGDGRDYDALDVEDPCPDAPPAYDGPVDEDGCPERPSVVVTDTEIEILDKIHFEFDSSELRQDSFPILDQIAGTLEDNPDITLVEIQGHTDQQGNPDYNLDLSDRRAASVLEYLVEAGIDRDRLTSKGYGEEELLNPAHTEEAYAENRRVEFLIVERAGEEL